MLFQKINATCADQIVIPDYAFSEKVKKNLLKLNCLVYALLNEKIELSPHILLDMSVLTKTAREFIDIHGAQKNTRWQPLRKILGAMQSFSSLDYTLRHVYRWFPRYNIDEKYTETIRNFEPDTLKTLELINKYLAHLLEAYIKETHKLLGHDLLIVPLSDLYRSWAKEEEFPGHLSPNVPKQETNAEEIAISLATSFLNMAENTRDLEFHATIKPENIKNIIPDIISEKRFTALGQEFHSYQTLYDTYLANSRFSDMEDNLPHLRNLISIAFQLTEASQYLSHYCERHADFMNENTSYIVLMKTEALECLVHYFVRFTDKFIKIAKVLSREIINKYAVIKKLELPIPQFRGFHVRPSTLVAKIVSHYGSQVSMILNNREYDATSPLDLFRANEEINHYKRRHAIQKIITYPTIQKNERLIAEMGKRRFLLNRKSRRINHERETWVKLREILISLWNEGSISLYDGFISTFDTLEFYPDESFYELVKRSVTTFQAQGILDINTDITVVFEGDQRVLEDLKILSNNGYGEDAQGNNINLPASLNYLSGTR